MLPNNIGCCPKNAQVTISDDTDAAIAETNKIGVNFLCTSSKTNITPAKGALKAAARPAPAPLEIKNLFSIFNLFVILPYKSATVAPNWIDGPSIPRDNPDPMAITPPTNL